MTPGLTLLILITVILIVWLALVQNARTYKPEFELHGQMVEHHTPDLEPSEGPAVVAMSAPPAVRVAETTGKTPVQPDDLTMIEGIGPKVNQHLQAAGIQTFAQLAESNTESLKALLETAGLQFIDPSTWTEQASLLSEGKSEAFKELKERLRGGRRVE